MINSIIPCILAVWCVSCVCGLYVVCLAIQGKLNSN